MEVEVSALMPPNADDVRKVIEERLAALEENDGLVETVTLEWRGSQLTVPVITMPLDLLSYNPGTHRIRAQRTLDPAKDRELDDNPYGPTAQAYLHDLLAADPAEPGKKDPSFEALQEDLESHGQSEPGLATREGILVNGNTRRAALKRLGQLNMRVGILPKDASRDDLDSIELSLQLRKEHKREYSFMNFLLAVEERVKAGWQQSKIQREFRIRAKTYERARWILNVVEDMIRRSTVQGSNGQSASLRLVDFETHQGKLEELYQAYINKKRTSPDEAEALKEQRLQAIVLGHSKTDIRYIEPDFANKYLGDLIPVDGSAVAPLLPVSIPGLDVTLPPPSAAVGGLQALTDKLLRAQVLSAHPDAATPAEVEEASRAIDEAKDVVDRGLTLAGKNARLQKKRLAPTDRLSDAVDVIRDTLPAIAEARATGNFDPGDLDDVLVSMKEALTRLAQMVSRDNVDDSEGINWLLDAVTLTDRA